MALPVADYAYSPVASDAGPALRLVRVSEETLESIDAPNALRLASEVLGYDVLEIEQDSDGDPGASRRLDEMLMSILGYPVLTEPSRTLATLSSEAATRIDAMSSDLDDQDQLSELADIATALLEEQLATLADDNPPES